MTDSAHTGADAPALMQLPWRAHVCSWPLTLGPMIKATVSSPCKCREELQDIA